MPSWLDEYQQLIVGAVGFTGVILTLLVNAWLNRSQHRRAVSHERTVLRTALAEELRINRESLAGNFYPLDNAYDDGALLIPLENLDEIYRNYVGKIGLLDTNQVAKVLDAYLSLREFPKSLLLLGKSVGQPPISQYVEVPSKFAPKLKIMCEGLIKKNRYCY